jgi:GNAT superfamily N-acetyltransferase
MTKSQERLSPMTACRGVWPPVPGQLIRARNREAADIDLCVQALATVHQTSGYPTNWPADPARWLTPSGIARAWIATTNELPIAGHVILRQLPASAAGERTAEVSRLFVVPAARRQGIALALLQETIHWAAANELDLVLEVTDHLRAARALYERAGFRMANTTRADWTTPDGQPVTLHQYVRSRELGSAAPPLTPGH